MANGIAGLRPFPTFDNKTGGITPVTLAPTTPRFPVARGVNIAPARKDVNPLSYLAPIGLSFLADKFFGGQPQPVETKTEEELLEMDPTQLARYKADLAYGGDKTQTTGQRIGELFTQYGPALFTDNDKELAAYINTANTMRAATRASEDKRILNKANFTANLLKDKKLTFQNYVDTESVGSNKVLREVTGLDHPQFGLLLNFPDNPNAIKKGPYKGYVRQEDAGGNFIKSGNIDRDRLMMLGDSQADKDLMKKYREVVEKDAAGMNYFIAANKLIQNFDQSEGEPLALLGGATSVFISDLGANLRGVSNSLGLGGQVFNQSTGQIAGELLPLLEQRAKFLERGVDTTTIDGQILNLAQTLQEQNPDSFTLFDTSVVDKSAFERVSALSDFFVLGYEIAGFRFGQTGRTLSDKDLAFALRTVGSGATQNKEVAKAQLMKVGYDILDIQDARTAIGYNPVDFPDASVNAYESAFRTFYAPPNIKNDKGELVPNWKSNPADPKNPWQYIDYETRITNKLGLNKKGLQINPIQTFKNHKSSLYTPGATGIGTGTGTGTGTGVKLEKQEKGVNPFN